MLQSKVKTIHWKEHIRTSSMSNHDNCSNDDEAFRTKTEEETKEKARKEAEKRSLLSKMMTQEPQTTKLPFSQFGTFQGA